jgi:ABC-2 type transport system permease protein
MIVPVIVLVAVMSRTGIQAERYDFYPFQLQAVLAIFVAAQAPELLSRDQRHQVLPLYFSRPIERSDYALAKLAAMTTAVFGIIAVPLLAYYLGSIATVTHDIGDVRHQSAQFALGLGNAAFHAVLLAALGMVLAAFARRRGFATAAIIGVYLISLAVYGAISSLPGRATGWAQLLSPFTLLDGVRVSLLHGARINDEMPGQAGAVLVVLAVTVGCVLVLLARYRRIST